MAVLSALALARATHKEAIVEASRSSIVVIEPAPLTRSRLKSHFKNSPPFQGGVGGGSSLQQRFTPHPALSPGGERVLSSYLICSRLSWRSLHTFKNRGDSLAGADAHRGQPKIHVAVDHVADQGRGDARAA